MPLTICRGARRGALLLIVIAVLTLFMLAGIMLMTLATRTRSSARAFAAATSGTGAGPIRARIQLREALLRFVRGAPRDTPAAEVLGESLLEDMYGGEPPLEGRATAITEQWPLLQATLELAGVDPTGAAELGGRVVTFDPDPDTGEATESYRILRASGSGPFTCWLVRVDPGSDTQPPKPPCPVVVNQPAFRAEAYDAFDDQNRWLTELSLQDGAVASVPRPAFAAAGQAAEVDNDNDGVADGIWLRGVLENQPAANGGEYEFAVSYLVVDLDSRINLNAHGSLTSLDYPATSNAWRNAPVAPRGGGYGPADVEASLLFGNPAEAASDPPPASDPWRRILGAQTDQDVTALTSSEIQRRPVAQVGAIAGRYGSVATPGAAGNDALSALAETVYDGAELVDLKGLIKTDVELPKNSSAPVPEAVSFAPDWDAVNLVDDPYEMRLDEAAARPVDLGKHTQTAIDNPFTLAELEAVLRQFDADAQTLPPRLSVALDDFSQRSRLLVTTDSWDTPALTGPVAQEIENYLATLQCDPATLISPDVLAGLRFDINRPFPTGPGETAAKQEYCKHLYMLLVALGLPADASTAQWAANVVDYRDHDSAFTRFQFDSNPADGWGSGTAGWSAANMVWGLERPELVIAQTIAFYVQDESDDTTVQDAVYVSLYRPSWTEELRDAGGTYLRRTAGPLDLAEKPAQSSQPVWRLRIEPGTTVRFDKPGSGEQEVPGVFRKTGGGPGDASLGPDSYLVVMPTPQKSTGKKGFDTGVVQVPVDNAFKKFEINSGGVFKAEHWPGAASYQAGSDSMVFLERLEDPAKPWDGDPASADYNPYVILDRLGIKRVNRTGAGANNWKTFIREHMLWNNGPFETVGSEAGIVPLDPSVKSWLPWPNRAYVSHAELLLVPQGGGDWRFWDFDIPKKRKERGVKPYYELPTPKLLEAAIVPSRFVGSQVSVDPARLAPVGMGGIPFNQLSRYREPGRVNLNTVVPNRSGDPAAATQLEDAVWLAVLGTDAAVSLADYRDPGGVPENPAPGSWPAKSLTEMLTLLQGPNIHVDTHLDQKPSAARGKSWKKNRLYDENPAAAYTTAIRLANVATIRSHVFAVWLTLRVRESGPAGNDSYHRLFAIVDRSRPVGFSAGENLNVGDAIRLLRFLE
jgi:hypothetical protein